VSAPLKPQGLEPIPENIPNQLKELSQWCVWGYRSSEKRDKWTKPPFNAAAAVKNKASHASSTKPQTWSDFDTALEAYRVHPPMHIGVKLPESQKDDPEVDGLNGLGFFPTQKDNLCGVDLDHCFDDDGKLKEWVLPIVERFKGTYMEVSPSGKGLRIFCYGQKPGTASKRGDVEMYDGRTAGGKQGGRYLTVTGHSLGEPQPITDKQEAVTWLYKTKLEPENKKKNTKRSTAKSTGSSPVTTSSLDDDALLEKMFASKHGADIKRLWDGDTSAYAKDANDGASEGDQALSNHLAWWCDFDMARTDRLFRQSGLMRPKWDEKHGAGTYGQMTLDKAASLGSPGDGYQPPRERVTVSNSKATGGRVKVILHPDNYLQSQDLIAGLHIVNQQKPEIFQRGRDLVRVVPDQEGTPHLETLDVATLRSHAQARLECVREKETKDDVEEVPANVSRDVSSYILTAEAWPFPWLNGVTTTPHFDNEGKPIFTPGYSPASRLYLHLTDYQPENIPETPTAQEVEAARSLILNELMADFPFADEASRCHAVCFALLPTVRSMISGPTPAHAFDASTPGTGKSLLAEVLTVSATGQKPKVMSEGGNDDEWRKRITSALIDSPPGILIDNVNRMLDSGALSAAFTSQMWSDRLLGQSKNVSVINLASWAITGNNIRTSKELARRLLWIRLDAKMERPWERTDFKHPQIVKWAEDNRQRIMHALLTLVRHWIAQGRPQPHTTLGSFEAWSNVVGGVVTAAGIPGFLGNVNQFYDLADAESAEWRTFIDLWWYRYKNSKVTVKDLVELAKGAEILLSVIGDGSERSELTRFGRALGAKTDTVIGKLVLKQGDRDPHTKKSRFYLAELDLSPEDDAESLRNVAERLRNVGLTRSARKTPSQIEKNGVAERCGTYFSSSIRVREKENLAKEVSSSSSSKKNIYRDGAKGSATFRSDLKTPSSTVENAAERVAERVRNVGEGSAHVPQKIKGGLEREKEASIPWEMEI
jgi:Uncharacterized conserved protein